MRRIARLEAKVRELEAQVRAIRTVMTVTVETDESWESTTNATYDRIARELGPDKLIHYGLPPRLKP